MEENGFQNRRKYRCSAALRGRKNAEEREQPTPLVRKKLGSVQSHIAYGGPILLHVPAWRSMSGPTVTQPWKLGRRWGEIPGLRRVYSLSYIKPYPVALGPHTFVIGSISFTQYVQSPRSLGQRWVGWGKGNRLSRQEGRNPVYS